MQSWEASECSPRLLPRSVQKEVAVERQADVVAVVELMGWEA